MKFRNRIMAAVLIAALVIPLMTSLLPAEVQAKDQYGFTVSEPDDFNAKDGKNPYGAGYTALNPISELFMIQSASGSYDASYWNDIKTTEGITKGTKTTLESKKSQCDADYVSSKAFDPDGKGHDYMVASTGLRNKKTVVWTYNTKTGKKGTVIDIDMGTGDNSDWFGSISQWEYTGFFTLTAGDFDGDGADELAVYVPYRGNPHVRIYECNSSGTLTEKTTIKYTAFMEHANVSAKFSNNGKTARAMVQASLEAADINRDGRDELLLMGSFANLHEDSDTKPITDRSSTLAVYQFTNSSSAKQFGSKFRIQGNGCYIRSASCAAGDIDYDGFSEIVVAGYYTTSAASDSLSGDEFAMTTLDYNPSTGKLSMGAVQKISMNGFVDGGLYTSDTIQAPPALVCAAVDGRNAREKVFLEGTVYSYDDEFEEDHTAKKYQSSDKGIDGYIISNGWIESAIVGNFDGNDLGIEQIVYTAGYKQNSLSYFFYNVNLIGKPQTKDSKGNATSGKYYDKLLQYVHYHRNSSDHLFVSLAAVDADNDTGTMVYSKKEYTYTNVDVLALLQAAPYFEDLADGYYDALGSTAFGKVEGGGTSTTKTKHATAGAYISADVDILGLFEFTSEATYTHEWQWEYENESTIEYSVNFAGGAGENSIVLYRTPVTLYYYTVYPVSGKSYTMTVGIQDNPVYSIMDVEVFNEIAKKDNDLKDKVITDDIIRATPGQPQTYPNSGAGLKNFTGYKTTQTCSSSTTNSEVTQSITKGTQTSASQSYDNSFELKVGAKVGTVAGGAIAGGGWGNGTTTFSYESVDKGGTVAFPPKTNGTYQFDWKFGTWTADVGDTEVPVLGYIVTKILAPPSLPQDIVVDTVTQNSITLGWTQGFVPALNYEIYQYFDDSIGDDGYSLLATISGNEDSYTCEGLESGKAYQFAIRAIGKNENNEQIVSEYSPLVTGVTLKDGSAPTIHSISDNQNVCTGDSASFTVDATPSAGVTNGVTYAWQVQPSGDSLWSTVSGGSGSTLTLKKVTDDMDGNRYRCIVSEVKNGNRAYTYSEARTLNVSRADSSLTVTALSDGDNQGQANSVTASTIKRDTEAVKELEVTINGTSDTYYVYKNTAGENPEYIYRSTSDNGYYVLTNPDEDKGTADSRILLNQQEPYFASDEEGTSKIEGLDPDEFHGPQSVYEVYDDKDVVTAEYNEYAASKESNGTVEDSITVYGKGGIYYTMEDEQFKVWKPEDIDQYVIVPIYEPMPGTASIIDEESNETTEYEVWYMNDKVIYQTGDRYYQVTESDGQKVLTQIYLIETDTLTAVVGEGTEEETTYNAVPADSPVIVKKQVDDFIYTSVSGETVTLQATVTSGSAGKAVDGIVTFKIVNNETGDITTLTENVSGKNKGTATKTWIPDKAGNYTITATYSGNNYLNVSSGSTEYYAYDCSETSYTGYILEGEDITYGEAVELTPKGTENQNGSIKITDLPEGTSVSYSVTYTDADGKTKTEQLSGPSYSPQLAGTYIFNASVTTSEKIAEAQKIVKVLKRPIVITAPSRSNISSTETDSKLPDMEYAVVKYAKDETKTAILEKDMTTNEPDLLKALLDIFTSPELTKDSGANAYVTSLTWKTKDAETEGSDYTEAVQKFRQKYDVTLKNGTYNVTQGIYQVIYQAGSNGSILAYRGDNSVSFASGDYVDEDSKLAFTAVPDENFQVKSWRIKDAQGTELIEGTDYRISGKRLIVDSVKKNIQVEVTFEPSSYDLTFSAGENGALNAYYLTDGTEGTKITSPEKVGAGKGIRFTAVPDEGYVVKGWYIQEGKGTETLWKYEDRSTYSENTLDFERLNDDMTVRVEFEEEDFYQVETSVTSAAGAAAGASINVDGLTKDGTARKGSTLTFTADIPDTQIIQEWRVYDTDDTYEVVSGNVDSYMMHNIQKDVKVELVINTFTKYKLHFQAVNVDDSNKVVENVITATWKEAELTDGTAYTAYIPIEFTADVPNNMQIKDWTIRRGTSEDESTGVTKESFAVSSLDQEMWVTLELEQRPQLTYAASDDNGTIICKETPAGGYLDKYQKNAELVLSPKTGYEVDRVLVSGAEYVLGDVKSDSDNRILTVTPANESDGFTEGINIMVYFKEISHSASVSYEVMDLGEGRHGTLTAQVERKGMEDYAKSSEELEAGTLKELYRDSNVILKVNPDEGYEVQKWTVNGKEITEELSTDANKNDTLTLPVDGTTEYKVVVQLVEAGNKLTFGVKGDEGGTVTAWNNRTQQAFYSGNTLAIGTSITFTAKANDDYELKGWEVDGKTAEGETSETFTMQVPKGTDTKVEAVFEKIPDETTSTITFGSNDETLGTVTAAVTESNDSHKIASGDTVKNGSTVSFTAAPADGYMVEGWYTDADCKELIENTAEKIEYSQDSIKEDTIIYVKFVKIPLYTITVEKKGTGKGSLSAKVEDESVEIQNGTIEAPYHSKVTITATPYDENSCVSAWNDKESSSDSYVIEDVTKDTVVTATFSTVEMVDISFYVSEEDVTEASLETGYASESKWENVRINSDRRMIKGKSARFQVTPLDNKMIDTWTVTYTDGTIISGSELGLENELLLEKVEKGVKVEVKLKDVVAYDVPSKAEGCDIKDLKLTPNTLSDQYEGQVRESGSITFMLTPEKGKGIVKIVDANGSDESNVLTAKANGDGSYTVTISNILKSINLQVETFDYYQVTIPKTSHGSVKAVITGKYTDTITLTEGQSASVPEGSTINLQATPENHYVFGKWTYHSEYKPEIDTSQSNVVIKELSDNLEIAASFEWENWYYTLQYTQPGHGTIQVKDEQGKKVSSGDKVLENTKLTFTITPENCYEFAGWGGSLSGTQTSLTTAINKNMTVTANIKAAAHTYGEPTFTWNGTSSATATFTCTKCGKTETVNCTITSKTGTNEITYTAKAVLDGKTWTKDSTVPNTQTETHTYGKPVFTWNGTSSATAAFTCTKCGKTETVKCTITSKTGTNKITYTAKAVYDGKTWTETKSVDITISNTDFRLQGSVGAKKVKLSWTRVPGAKGYDIWYGKCGSRKMKLMKSVKSNSKRTWTFTKKGSTSYKYYVKAYKMVNGKKKYLNKSNTIHLSLSAKYTNVKKVKAAVSKFNMKKGRQKKLSVKIAYEKKGKKLVRHMNGLIYSTTNAKVASVTKKGIVRARAKGSCYIYVTAYSGAYAKVKVTVK